MGLRYVCWYDGVYVCMWMVYIVALRTAFTTSPIALFLLPLERQTLKCTTDSS